MIATIVSYWFVSLPGVVTGVVLLKLFNDARKAKQAKAQTKAVARKR